MHSNGHPVVNRAWGHLPSTGMDNGVDSLFSPHVEERMGERCQSKVMFKLLEALYFTVDQDCSR